ncbi:hypothetical protein FACS1894106_4540 [Spirochaetia bacterium]|nr:hypothetical protein FACS1894106_4540 [Spirochaetia bacterium]
MEQGITQAIITAFIDGIFSKGDVLFKQISDEVKATFRTGINDYIIKQRDKYSQIKTLLHGNTPIYLYQIYYELDLRTNKTVIDTSNISNLFKRTKCVTIIGDAGSGKTTLMKHLFLNSIVNNYAIPVLIELRYLNDFADDFSKYIIKKALDLDITENEEILTKLLDRGNFVLFLDGYDELKNQRKRAVIESINDFVTKYNKNKYIITSRPYSDIEQFPTFTNMWMNPLSEEDLPLFVSKQLQNEPELSTKINNSIVVASKENKYVKTFFVNPLLIVLYILTYQTNPNIPNKKFVFFRRVITALFSEHDSKLKLGFTHEIVCELTHEQIEDVLKAFCFVSFFASRYEWDIDYINSTFDEIKKKKHLEFENQKLVEDLKKAVSLWTEDNGSFGFAHRSLQEYFAASFIKNLNPDAKENVYKKIITNIAFRRERGGDYKNILDLLEEMDTLAFNKYYYEPLLDELGSAIDNSSDEKLLKSLLVFFIKDYAILPKNERVFNINWQKIGKTIYLHLRFTQKLFNILVNELNMNSTNINGSFSKSKTKSIVFKPIDDDFFALIKKENKENILSIANEFNKYIQKKTKDVKSYIASRLEVDNSFLNMIS